MFRCGVLLRALEAALDANRMPTDEAQAIEWSGQRPRLVAGRADNIKVTTADDLALAAAILERASVAGVEVMRIGSGFDVHAFGPGDSIVLGGVRIPHYARRGGAQRRRRGAARALRRHARRRGAGRHRHAFSRTPTRCGRAPRAGASSPRCCEMLSVRKLKVGNADITLLAQSPKVSPYRLEIRRSLAQMLGVTENQVNIKATTTEHLGFIGRNEGLAAQAVVLLETMPEPSA